MRGMGFGIPSWVSQLILQLNWRVGAVNITVGSGQETGWKQAEAWLLGAVSRKAWLKTQLCSD
ncbi:hypothetical protein CGCSCA1_v006825 [Colletotrichum siamense]|nr:hypothetical protein CGCSCA1_v006825 [Colletotrichum siamense]